MTSVIAEKVASKLVPVRRVPITEVTRQADMAASLSRIMQSTLPGFIIRRSNLDGRTINKDEMIGVLIAELAALDHDLSVLMTYPGLVKARNLTEPGLGKLHLDLHEGAKIGEVGYIDDHKTTSGAALVSLALSGEYFANQNAKSPGLYDEVNDELHDQLLRGQTNPDYIQPIIHQAEVRSGDHVIFGQGLVWHRFDTLKGPRGADITELY